MVDVVAGRTQRGEHRRVGDRGAVIAEQTAADYRSHSGIHQNTQLIAGERVGHGDSQGDADGKRSPRGAGEERDDGAYHECDREEQGVIQPAVISKMKSAAPMDLVMVLMQ